MKKDIDMLNGPLFGRLIIYTIPIIISGLLQLLFSAVDMIVVGKFAGPHALAAVGSSSPLINLLTNFFIGLSVGANVLTAHFVGAGREDETQKCVHTAIATALISGVVLAVIGFFAVAPILKLMGTPIEVINLSTLYLRIYFVGMPVVLLYNYGSAILRAVGDTRNPLWFLIIAGVINLIMNLFFVIALNMSVAGVAWATVISQAISACLTLRCLSQKQGSVRFNWRKTRIDAKVLARIMQIGIPAGLQGTLFSFSNVIIQSSINLFGAAAMAANAAAASIGDMVYISMNAFHQTTLNFVGQNAGARQYERIKKILVLAFAMVTVWGFAIGCVASLFSRQLMAIYADDPNVIEIGVERLLFLCLTYFMCGQMEVVVGALRGMGVAVRPMIISLIGACVFRLVWIATVFQSYKSLKTLYISYPISWIVTTVAQLICFVLVYRKYSGKTVA